MPLPQTIKAVQENLKKRGLYDGPIDGLAGNATWAGVYEAIVGPLVVEEQHPQQSVPNVDTRTAGVILTLHPKAQEKFYQLYAAILSESLSSKGKRVTPKFISGTRSYSEQESIYAQGRTKPGKIVTYAPPGYSNHNFGIAVDIGFFDFAGRYIDDLADRKIDGWTFDEVDALYEKAGEIGKALGFEWGGDWKNKDLPHFQLRPPWAKNIDQNQMLSEMRKRRGDGSDIWA